MKAEEIMKHYTLNLTDKSNNKWRVIEVENAEDYANQRVVDELEDLKLCNGVGIELEFIIDEIIKELKQ
tara:strand:+ start:446 stop:652 length:207 start_codon:yes stop_codon:yes gene_type:complete